MRFFPESQVRTRLHAGGRRIRTAGPPLRRGAFLNRLLPPLQLAKPVETEVFDRRGTGGSNPSSSSGESGANLAPRRPFPFLVGAGLLPYVVEDLVAGLARNAERATDLAHRFAVQQPSDEPQALVHHRTLLPRHPHLPRKGRKGERCYPCVRYDLS